MNAASAFFSLRGVVRTPVWYAGYVLGQIKRSSKSGADYPPPPFTEHNVPDDAPPDFISALHHWYSDPRLAACVEDGVVKSTLPPLQWLELTNQAPPSSPGSVRSAGGNEQVSDMDCDTDGQRDSDVNAASDDDADADAQDTGADEGHGGSMRDIVMSCLMDILGDDASSPVTVDEPDAAVVPVTQKPGGDTDLGLPTEGASARREPRKPSVLLDQVEKIASRLDHVAGHAPPNLKLTESLVRLWGSMTPVMANLKDSELKGFTKDHEYLKKYVLPDDQRVKFMAPTLGPQTTQWLYQADPQVMKADTFMSLDVEILHNICVRVLRWFDILKKKLKAVQEDETEATTVSIDAVDLLDDMSEAMELLGAQVRQLNSRRLRHFVQKLPKNPSVPNR